MRVRARVRRVGLEDFALNSLRRALPTTQGEAARVAKKAAALTQDSRVAARREAYETKKTECRGRGCFAAAAAPWKKKVEKENGLLFYM